MHQCLNREFNIFSHICISSTWCTCRISHEKTQLSSNGSNGVVAHLEAKAEEDLFPDEEEEQEEEEDESDEVLKFSNDKVFILNAYSGC